MAKQNGFYEYGVSPYQLRTFKGMLNPGLPQYILRTAKQLIFVAPPLIGFYSLAKWADAKVRRAIFDNNSLNIIPERNI